MSRAGGAGVGAGGAGGLAEAHSVAGGAAGVGTGGVGAGGAGGLAEAHSVAGGAAGVGTVGVDDGASGVSLGVRDVRASLDSEGAVAMIAAIAMEMMSTSGGAGPGAGGAQAGGGVGGGGPAGSTGDDSQVASSWKFSGRWWAAPLALRRSRPIKR